MLSSPLVALLALLAGVGGAVVLAWALLPSVPASRRWATGLTLVVFAAVGAAWPANMRDVANRINGLRIANREAPERAARERCLNDAGQTALPGALEFARRWIPEDARYRLVTSAAVKGCVALNMLPRRPAHPETYDAQRDWTIHHGAVPSDVVERAQRDQSLPESERRYEFLSPGFVVERPGAGGTG